MQNVTGFLMNEYILKDTFARLFDYQTVETMKSIFPRNILMGRKSLKP